MTMLIEIQLIAVIVAVACALPGVFLVLRSMTMLSDAITHTVLLGIVLAFFITQDLNSPLLMVGATLVGVATVWLIEALQRTNLVKNDAAIGIVFPLFFSVAIVLITRYAGDVHLDVDAVLMGELAFAPFRRLEAFGMDFGPKSLWSMLVILVLNSLFVALFYKELKLTTFDPGLAKALGFSPALLHYGLMTLVSLTAVGAYDSVGSILVVGFMVGPALTGYLLTRKLGTMIAIAMGTAVFNSLVGVNIAFAVDASLAGMIAVVTGITAFLAFLFSPEKGWVQRMHRRRKQQKAFNERLKEVK